MPSLLIVEDERWEREGLIRLIQKPGGDFDPILSARDGEEGLEAIEKHRPDVVITDVRMPGLTGLEMLEKAGDHLRESVCVILSGYNEFEYARNALKIGALDYLLKPVEEAELWDTLKRAREILAQRVGNGDARGEIGEGPGETEDGLKMPQAVQDAVRDIGHEQLRHTEEYVLRRTIEIICNEYGNPDLHLSTIASRVYLSTNYVGALFKRLTGVTFNDYLNRHRMEVAAELLGDPGRKISWIAKQVGIPNTSYFCVLFKQEYGMTPSEYRRTRASSH